jgi:nucleotide-binding universal stress UspA family protein
MASWCSRKGHRASKEGTIVSIFPTKILLATDGSEEARLALTTAADMAQSTDSELHVAYVFPTAVQRPFPNPITARPREVQEHELEEAMQQAQHFLDQQVERVKEEGVSVAETHLVRGRPDREVIHLSEEIGAGLIIMGSRGLGGVRRALMGSVSDSVVRHAHCPVMIVRE